MLPRSGRFGWSRRGHAPALYALSPPLASFPLWQVVLISTNFGDISLQLRQDSPLIHPKSPIPAVSTASHSSPHVTPPPSLWALWAPEYL